MADAALINQALNPEPETSETKRRLLDRAFSYLFKNLVYPQIWEDPEPDIAALRLRDGMRLVTIASGGCNVLNYLSVADIQVTALDINETHIALNKLKHTALQHLPSYEAFFRFFGYADEPGNRAAYQRYIRPHLDAESRAYWEGRGLSGRQRLGMFTRNFYRYGLLGSYIGAVHLVSRLHGKDPRRMLEARSPEEQRWLFENTLAPVFRSKLVRKICDLPVSLYGLGIPPAQFEELKAASKTGAMADVLYERLERLACDFDISDNYFAWQAFGRRYDREQRKAVPRYLRPDSYEDLKARLGNIKVVHANFAQHLTTCADASLDAFILLDAQDWMNDAQLTELWRQIDRTAAPGARVIFRTAGTDTILPGRVPEAILQHWHYEQEASKRWHAQDRSSIYGGFHAYEKVEAA